MNRPPEILVNSGFVTDQNGVLTEMVIPASVMTMRAPTKITYLGDTLIENPIKTYEFEAPNIATLAYDYHTGSTPPFSSASKTLQKITLANCKAISSIASRQSGGLFSSFINLSEFSAPNLETLYSDGGYGIAGGPGCFAGCTSLTSLSFPKLILITSKEGTGGANGTGCFQGCTGITTLNLPELVTIEYLGSGYGAFSGCTGLTTVSLPKISSLGGYTFKSCTSLSSVTLGSANHPVSSITNTAFNNCTQSGLTITIYTQGGASLSGEPWGATNATIEYEEA